MEHLHLRTTEEKFENALHAIRSAALKPDLRLIQTGEVTLNERERIIMERADWLIKPTYVAGCGLFETGSIEDGERERIITGLLKAKLEQGGAVVHPISIDVFMETEPAINIVHKIMALSQAKDLNVRDQQGRPRAILVTGFTQSRFLTANGLRWITESLEAQNPEVMKDGNLRKQLENEVYSAEFLSETLNHLEAQNRERLAAYAFVNTYMVTWQQLTSRKNSTKENIITINIMPTEALEAFLTFETGTRAPLGAASDFLYRCRPFFSNR